MDDIRIPESIRGDPWFEDGNIILLAEPEHSPTPDDNCDADGAVAFKVHRGVLARHSEVFQSMFEVAQSPSDADNVERCPVVRMYDLPLELSSLIKALYDGPHGLDTGNRRHIDQFFYVAGILRLSTKYCIAHLRLLAIRHLTQTWAYTLRGHDEMIQRAISTAEEDGLSYPYIHPLHVLNLARATEVSIVVPSALYFLSLYHLQDVISGEHPKLKIQHPSVPSSSLTAGDLQDYTLMFQHRVQMILDFVRRTCGLRQACKECKNGSRCTKTFAQLTNRLSREWVVRTGPIHFMSQTIEQLSRFMPTEICSPCRVAFTKDVERAREEAWKGLPIAVGLPCWEQLEATDLRWTAPT